MMIIMSKKDILNMCYTELNKADVELMEKNRKELKETHDVKRFFKAEEKRKKKFKKDLLDILEMEEIFKEKGIE